MKDIEILSPVGNIENFYTAVHSGADAVYLGLPKFNARLKADNITEDNIREIVKYAHLHKVKVYITLNTLVWDDEYEDLLKYIDLLVSAKVDAFIVQDYATISTLSSRYKGVEIHASTQLGVHNLYGAKMLESMGVSRVVLSRETKLSDIKLIKENTNLELEYFVQGALCVAFSGNCYFSALRTGGSGNRGECKQLCRMPYTAKINGTEVDSGYMLSARDLSLLPRLKDLIDAGVTSFKIEGRLRRASFVALATSTYRKAVDDIMSGKDIDIEKLTQNLSRVFNRGKYVTAYLDQGVPNNIVNKFQQNHIGERIGEVVKVEPFKKLYRIHLKLSKPIHSNDGLKFLKDGREVGSLGVGNIDRDKSNYIIYTTRVVPIGSDVHLCLDSEYEDSVMPTSKTIDVDVSVKLFAGSYATFTISSKDTSITYSSSDIVESARSTPITKDNVLDTVYKLNKMLRLNKVSIDMDSVFMPKSKLNELRREAESLYLDTLIDTLEKYIVVKRVDYIPNTIDNTSSIDRDITLVYDDYDITTLGDTYVAVDFRNITPNILREYMDRYSSVLDYPLIVNLPIIANGEDLKLIDSMLEVVDASKIILLSNNIYGLYYISKGYKVIASNNMNVSSHEAYRYLKNIGVMDIVWSIENNYSDMGLGYRGFPTLMTVAHCPYKTIYGNTCDNCSYSVGLKLCTPTSEYRVERSHISQCYFRLVNDEEKFSYNDYSLIDLR